MQEVFSKDADPFQFLIGSMEIKKRSVNGMRKKTFQFLIGSMEIYEKNNYGRS